VDAKLGMIWYPSIDDVIDVNIDCLDLTRDRHPHKLRGSREGIQAIIDKVRQNENKGLSCQAALLMKKLVEYHPFDGANHRTAYIVAKMFLRRNGKRMRVAKLETAYPFIRNLGNKTLEEVQGWIENGTSEEP